MGCDKTRRPHTPPNKSIIRNLVQCNILSDPPSILNKRSPPLFQTRGSVPLMAPIIHKPCITGDCWQRLEFDLQSYIR